MQTIEDMLSSFVGTRQKDWDKYIPLIMMAYRSSVHETTGVTPLSHDVWTRDKFTSRSRIGETFSRIGI